VQPNSQSALPGTCTTGDQFSLTAVYKSAGSYVYQPGNYTCVATNTWSAGINMLTSGQGSLWPPFGGFPGGTPATTTALGAANTLQCVQFNNPGTFSVANWYAWETTGDSGKYVGVNFYDTVNTSNPALIGSTTTTGAVSAANTHISGAIGPLTLGPGAYNMCVASNSANTLVLVGNNDGNAYAASISSTDSTKRQFKCSNTISVSSSTITWPATCGTVTATAPQGFPSWIMLGN
jgi:hypothetical protein